MMYEIVHGRRREGDSNVVRRRFVWLAVGVVVSVGDAEWEVIGSKR